MDIRGKKILVTGGAGFIGSHTIDHLLKEDVGEIVIYDNFCRGRIENLAHALRDPRVRVFESGGDILHTDTLASAMKQIDVVFHFAALWLLHCQEHPRMAFEVNVKGTFNVLEACTATNVRRLVLASSASVYGDAQDVPMTEDHPFNNKTFYGATKIASEAIATSMYHRYGLVFVGMRYMNVYGSRQDYRGAYVSVIMRMLDALDQGQPIPVFGDGLQSFDFVHVSDCAKANVRAMKSATTDRFYNVGTGRSTSVLELAQLLKAKLGGTIEFRADETSFVRTRVASTRLASEEMGFTAEVTLEAGLQELIEWRAADRLAAISRTNKRTAGQS